jgi:hypothetical protein
MSKNLFHILTYTLSDVMRTHMCSYASPTTEAYLLVHPNTPSLFCP